MQGLLELVGSSVDSCFPVVDVLLVKTLARQIFPDGALSFPIMPVNFAKVFSDTSVNKVKCGPHINTWKDLNGLGNAN